ncbi:MAG: hypothetical protein DWQ33_10500 [Bacteroidetes bacterium]|nr:MAG: hypothetical protein DWQ33_10500 [Bacteroidota bacterium]
MKKTLIGLLLLLYGQRAHSIVQDSVYRFSAKQAVEYALQNQMDVQNARLDAGISKAQVREIVGIGLPQVNSSFDVQHFVELPTSLLPAEFFEGEAGEFIPIQFGTKWNATGNLSASQLLFDPTYLLGVKATRTFHELATRNLSRTETETALNVYKAYYNNLLLIERRKVLDANVQRITKLHDDTKALYENGFVEKLDYDRVKLELNNIRSEQDKFGRLILLSDQILKFQIGMNAQMKLILTDSLSSSDIKNISVPLEKADVTKRIEYSILQTQSQLQEYNIRRYRAGYYPTLHAYGSLSANAQRTEMNFFDSDRR